MPMVDIVLMSVCVCDERVYVCVCVCVFDHTFCCPPLFQCTHSHLHSSHVIGMVYAYINFCFLVALILDRQELCRLILLDHSSPFTPSLQEKHHHLAVNGDFLTVLFHLSTYQGMPAS